MAHGRRERRGERPDRRREDRRGLGGRHPDQLAPQGAAHRRHRRAGLGRRRELLAGRGDADRASAYRRDEAGCGAHRSRHQRRHRRPQRAGGRQDNGLGLVPNRAPRTHRDRRAPAKGLAESGKAVPKERPGLRNAAWYSRFAKAASHFCGRPRVFALAVGVIAAWVVTGPIFGFSDTWQLVINTGTTIVTFLMVFLIQNTQNRDTEAIQVKLDELIRATQGAHNALLDLAELADENLDAFRSKYQKLAGAARGELDRGRDDTGTPEA